LRREWALELERRVKEQAQTNDSLRHLATELAEANASLQAQIIPVPQTRLFRQASMRAVDDSRLLQPGPG
jgi:hypothetical protein